MGRFVRDVEPIRQYNNNYQLRQYPNGFSIEIYRPEVEEQASVAAAPEAVSIDPIHQAPILNQLEGFDPSFRHESANNGLSQDHVDRHHYILKKELQF